MTILCFSVSEMKSAEGSTCGVFQFPQTLD